MTTQVLLSLITPPAIEGMVVDWLLEHNELSGFTSFEVDGHGSSVNSMSLSEQVRGRRREIMFQVYLDETLSKVIIEKLKADFSGTGIHYWIVPVVEQGRLV